MPEEVVLEKPAGTEVPAGTEKPVEKPAGSEQRPDAGKKPGDDPWVKEKAGILADLQKERTARVAAEARHKDYQTQLDQEKQRLHLALGINTPSKEDADTAEVKAAFAKLFPHLANLTPEQIERLQDVAAQGDELKSTNQRYWENHGKQMLAKVHSSISDELGGGDLTPRQRQSITNAYIAQAGNDPEFLKRHEAGDDTLIEEFVKNFVEDWGGPIRRSVTSTELGRSRPLPNGRGRNVQAAAPRKIDFNNPKAVEDALVESYKSHGGTFPG